MTWKDDDALDELISRVGPKVHNEIVTAETIERHRKLDPKARVGDTVQIVEDSVFVPWEI